MKNNITITAALFLLLTVGFGCSYIDNLSNSKDMTNSSKNSNSADANLNAKTGVAECDEFIDLLNKDKADPNDGFLMRKGKEILIDYAKEEIKRNIEQNQGDKTKIAQGCKEARDEYIRNKEKNNSNQNSSQKSDNSQSF